MDLQPKMDLMTDALFDLSDRVAVVSGAARGMGKAMSLALADAGADVLLIDLNEEGLQTTADEVRSLGRKAIAYRMDVAEPTEIRAMFARLDEEFGRIDFLGNVAGEGVRATPEEITLDDIERSFRILVVGRFCLCQEAGRRMLAAGHGSIVNIGSLAATTALGRGHIAYSMSMGAVVQMTRELSIEWSHRGVRCNAILPAQVMNPGLKARIESDARIKDKFLSGIPINRFGHPDDIRGLSVFLASDASSFITGALIPMDGGNLAMNAGGSPGHEVFEE